MRGAFDDSTDWIEMISIANDYLVGPDLHRALLRSASPAVDPDAMEYLERLDQANRERNASLSHQVADLARRGEEAGLRPLILKGAALLVQLGDPGETGRMVGDIDLLAPDGELPATRGVLGDLGYRLIEGSARGHSAGTYWKAGGAGTIDLHASLPSRMAYMVSERELDEHSRWIGFRGTRVRVPDPSLHLVMNIGHEMIHDAALYSGMTELRYLLELRELVETKHAEIDWSWVRGKFGHRSFRLAMEAQDRMARDLLGARLFDDLDDTTVGYWLHRRRIVKSRFELAGRIEWSFVRRLLAIGDVPGA